MTINRKIMRSVYLFAIIFLITFHGTPKAISLDSLFEPIVRTCDLLPEYYLRFNLSTFALHNNAFFKRQYLAEPQTNLEFQLISYRDIISSVWDVEFLFGLGEVPGNTVFTLLNVGFGIDPKIEFKTSDYLIISGLVHHCYHEIDEGFFPLIHNNRFHLGVSTRNSRLNDYYTNLFHDTLLQSYDRLSWKITLSYYLKEFFGLVSSGKLNGNTPEVFEHSIQLRYAFYRRRSWVFSFLEEHTLGNFNKKEAYKVRGNNNLFWKFALGVEAFFTRGNQGGCFFIQYHLDDLPVPVDAPKLTCGNWRFSKNRLLQMGIRFFN